MQSNKTISFDFYHIKVKEDEEKIIFKRPFSLTSRPRFIYSKFKRIVWVKPFLLIGKAIPLNTIEKFSYRVSQGPNNDNGECNGELFYKSKSKRNEISIFIISTMIPVKGIELKDSIKSDFQVLASFMNTELNKCR